jgi:HEAT repeats
MTRPLILLFLTGLVFLTGCQSYGPPAGEKWRQFWLGISTERELSRLNSDDSDVRRWALVHLGRAGHMGHALSMARHLDPKEEPVALVRVTAAMALRKIGSPAVLVQMVSALKDRDDFVRAEAARTLGDLGTAREVEPLSAVLANDFSDEVRLQAAYALGRIGEKKAAPSLVTALADPHLSISFAAQWSLVQLTGKDLAPSRDIWRKYLKNTP